MELTDNDRKRIEQEATQKADYHNASKMNIEWQAYYVGYIQGAHKATIYEREQQAEKIEKFKELLRTAEGALRFVGIERTADVIEKALKE